MDLNYLYLRRGMSLARAAGAACERSRAVHLELHRNYDLRIAALRPAVTA
jgi:hypothetical protein